MAMANARWAMVAVAVVMAMVGAEAATDCSAAISSVSGCATYLTNPSSTPDDKGCCQPLLSVLATPTSFQCLCAQASNSDTAALFKNALTLPKACKLNINVSEANCTTSTTPSTTPSTGTPSTANTTTPAGSSGFRSASPYLTNMATALVCAVASLLL